MPRLICGLVILNVLICAHSNNILQRTKRFLLFPTPGGTFKAVFGIAMPVNLGLRQSMSASLNFQCQYTEPQNASQLHNYPPDISRSLDKRDVTEGSDRMMAYLAIEAMMDRYGIDGRACLSKSICENAIDSTYHKANGIYGHLLHILLAPDYGDGKYEDDLDQDYIDAQKAGYYGVDCSTLYPDCPTGSGILDMFSIYD